MDNSQVNIDLIRDHVDTIILATLAKEDRYGLDILAEIEKNSNGLYKLKQPTLYSCLKRLEDKGYITSYKGDSSNGAQRVYYSLLDDGRKLLETDQYQWEYARTIINGLLSQKDFDPTQKPPFEASDLRPKTKRQPKSTPTAAEAADVGEKQILLNTVSPIDSTDEDSSPSIILLDNNNGLQTRQEVDSNSQDAQMIQQVKLINPELKQAIVNKDAVLVEQSVDYVNVLDNIFANDNTAQPAYGGNSGYNQNYGYSSYQETNDVSSQYSTEVLAKKFAEQGFILKPYIKKNTTEYYVNKYFYINKLLLVTSLYSYALFAVVLTILHFAFNSLIQTSSSSYAITLLSFLAIPAYFGISCVLDPYKRILADFNLKRTLSYLSIVFINLFLIIIIIGFVIFKATFDHPEEIVKYIVITVVLSLLIPADVIIFGFLYNTNHYHVN